MIYFIEYEVRNYVFTFFVLDLYRLGLFVLPSSCTKFRLCLFNDDLSLITFLNNLPKPALQFLSFCSLIENEQSIFNARKDS
jgi:hypothetical protein